MINYGLPISCQIRGKEYPINADFRAVLDIITALNDDNLTDQERSYIALFIFLRGDLPPDREGLEQAAAELMCFLAAGTPESGNDNAPVLVNWEKDFPLILPAINRAQGQEIRALPFFHWYSFVAAYMEIGECLFSTVIGIRDKKARHQKLEKYEMDFVKRNPQYFRAPASKLDYDLTEAIRRGDFG